MSWAVIQAIRSRSMFRLYTRINASRAYSSAKKTLESSLSHVELLHAKGFPCHNQQLNVIKLYQKTITEGPVSAEAEARMIEICDIMNGSPTLSLYAAIDIFTTLSLTSEWRRGVALLDKYDYRCNWGTVAAFNSLVANAFREDDQEVGWRMLRKIVVENYDPHCNSFLLYWNSCTLHHDDDNNFIERVEKMLDFIGSNYLLVSREVLIGLQSAFKNVGLTSMEIDFHAHCKRYDEALDNSQLSSDQFEMLKAEFENKNVEEEIKRSPSSGYEFDRFKLEDCKYDYVIDGLNVGHPMVKKIVEHCTQEKKRVLVIGSTRQEADWDMTYIKKHAKVFLAPENTDDDVFVLYAALQGGQNTYFVSNDRMEPYLNRMSADGKIFFEKWQTIRQIRTSYNPNEKGIDLQHPLKKLHFAHKNGKQQWHVPYRNERPYRDKRTNRVDTNVQDIKWACFTIAKLPTNSSEGRIDQRPNGNARSRSEIFDEQIQILAAIGGAEEREEKTEGVEGVESNKTESTAEKPLPIEDGSPTTSEPLEHGEDAESILPTKTKGDENLENEELHTEL